MYFLEGWNALSARTLGQIPIASQPNLICDRRLSLDQQALIFNWLGLQGVPFHKTVAGGSMTIRRAIAAAVTTGVLFTLFVGFSYAQLATSNAKQSDKVLFGRAMTAMHKSEYAAARTLLETLITGHPDSDYVPRAKLSVADAWYAQGAFKQAEMEYRDFITFFPGRPEVAQAQSKIDSIHKKAKS
jgi:TolA-binding protein